MWLEHQLSKASLHCVGGSLKGTDHVTLQSWTKCMGYLPQGVPVPVAGRTPWELLMEIGASALHRPCKDVAAHILQILQMLLPGCLSDCVHVWQERG